MTMKASTPAAWIVAAGLLACFATPSFAAEASPWPTSTGVAASNGQQAVPNAAVASDQAGTDAAAAQSDAADRSLSADQRPADAMAAAEPTDPNAAQVTAASDEGAGRRDLADAGLRGAHVHGLSLPKAPELLSRVSARPRRALTAAT